MPRKAKSKPPLLDYLDGITDKLRDQIPAAFDQQDTTAIHHARVATRRLSAAVHVLKPVLSKPDRHAFAAVLRKLRGRLGPLRDLDVMLGHLQEIKPGPSSNALDWIRGQLQNDRDGRNSKTRKKVDPQKLISKLSGWSTLRHEISSAHEAVDTLLCESLHLQLDAFVEHADAVASRGQGSPTRGPDDPHELRIAGKALRYSLEMAVEDGHKLPAGVTRTFKRMQDLLGTWHDFVVLAQCLLSLSLEHELSLHDAGLQSAVLEVAKLFLKRATRSLSQFSALWKARGEEISRTIRSAFPLTGPVDSSAFIELKTDPDPSHSAESSAGPAHPAELPDEPSPA